MKQLIVNCLAILIIGIGSCFLLLPTLGFAVGPSCTTSCNNNGCDVTIVQGSSNWNMSVNCDDGSHGNYSGSGQYSGTICGRVAPCQVY